MAYFKRVPELSRWLSYRRPDGIPEYEVTTTRGAYYLTAFERGRELAGYTLKFAPMMALSRKVSSKKRELGDVKTAEQGVRKAAEHQRALTEGLSPSEALYGFAAWLTTRKRSVTAGSKHNAAPWAKLVQTFADTNGMEGPREDWTKDLKHPTEGVSAQLRAALDEVTFDNQGRNLDALARQKKAEAERGKKHRAQWEKESEVRAQQYAKAGWKPPDWTRVKGVLVLRAGNDDYVAVPANGKKNAARFSIIDVKKGEEVVPILRKAEVREWLFRSWKSRHGF